MTFNVKRCDWKANREEKETIWLHFFFPGVSVFFDSFFLSWAFSFLHGGKKMLLRVNTVRFIFTENGKILYIT